MSLFSSFGQGDFWGKGFAFASPVNDLLDRGNYTLQELLDEDDVLQEVKAMNTRLIEFLSTESVVEELVTYLVDAPEADADEKRVHKFPYMACEVICCEVDPIVDQLTTMKEGHLIDRLFSLLDREPPLDDHLSGYFEKVLYILLKRKCLQVMSYINNGGLELFRKFVMHLGNYSIMQIVERLFLHQPGWDREGSFSAPVGLDLGVADDDMAGTGMPTIDLNLLRCSWSNLPEVVDLLVDKLREGEDPGPASQLHNHVAELLLNVIENSTPDSAFIRNLMTGIKRMVDLAIPELDLSLPPQELQEAALKVIKEEPSSMLSALTILEALLSRPQTIKMHWDLAQQAHQQAMAAAANGNSPPLSPQLDAFEPALQVLSEDVVEKFTSSLPLVYHYLRTHEVDDRTVSSQLRERAPKLGVARLKLVRLVEALVKLCHAGVDVPLETEGVLEVCLDMLFKYEWTSVLHQSITRIVTWIMDAGPSRLRLQTHLIKKCKLLEKILAADDANEEHETATTRRCRRGYMGHLYIMCQAIVEASRHGEEIGPEEVVVNEDDPSASFRGVMEHDVEPAVAERWHEFVTGRLAQVTALQCHPLGGYPIPSRADENKLSTDFNEPTPDFDQVSDMLAQRLTGLDLGKGAGMLDDDLDMDHDPDGGFSSVHDGFGGGGGGSHEGPGPGGIHPASDGVCTLRRRQPLEGNDEEEDEAQQQHHPRDQQGGGGTDLGRTARLEGAFDHDEVVFTLDDEKDNFEWASRTGASSGAGEKGGSSASGTGAETGTSTSTTTTTPPTMAAGIEGAGGGGGWADFGDFEAFGSSTVTPTTTPVGGAQQQGGAASAFQDTSPFKSFDITESDPFDPTTRWDFFSTSSTTPQPSSTQPPPAQDENQAAIAQAAFDAFFPATTSEDALPGSSSSSSGGGGGGEGGGAEPVKEEEVLVNAVEKEKQGEEGEK